MNDQVVIVVLMSERIEILVYNSVLAMNLEIPDRSSKHEIHWQNHCSPGKNGYVIPTVHDVDQELFTLRKETFAGLPICYGTYTNNDAGLWVAFGEADFDDKVYVASKNVFTNINLAQEFLEKIRKK